MSTARRTDQELNLYFGGRAEFLTNLRSDLAAAELRYAAGPQADDLADDLGIGAATADDWGQMMSSKLAELRDAIDANV